MARPKKNMSLTKVAAQTAARKRFKITFGKALQNVPGRQPVSAAPRPRAAFRTAVIKAVPGSASLSHVPRESSPTAPTVDIPVIKSQSGIDLTEKVKDLIILDKEQGYLTNEDIDNA